MHIDEAFALLRELRARDSITETEAYNAGEILKKTTHTMIGWSHAQNAIVFSVYTEPGKWRTIRSYDPFSGRVTVEAYTRKRATYRNLTLTELVAIYQ